MSFYDTRKEVFFFFSVLLWFGREKVVTFPHAYRTSAICRRLFQKRKKHKTKGLKRDEEQIFVAFGPTKTVTMFLIAPHTHAHCAVSFQKKRGKESTDAATNSPINFVFYWFIMPTHLMNFVHLTLLSSQRFLLLLRTFRSEGSGL